MLNPETERRICELLDVDTPRRAIARQTGASRFTVDAIAHGNRPATLSRSRTKPTVPDTTATVGKCPTCGRKIELPCRACAAEQFRREHPRPRPLYREPELAVALRQDEQDRYLALQAIRSDDPLPEP